jgi:hypothetical protein
MRFVARKGKLQYEAWKLNAAAVKRIDYSTHAASADIDRIIWDYTEDREWGYASSR